MISRRNIRVKVMQLLYVLETLEQDAPMKNPVAQLDAALDKTKELFVYLLYFLGEVARYAESDALARSSKLLPNAQDLNVNIKIAGNDFIWHLLENKSFQKALETYQPVHKMDRDLLKKIYLRLTETPEYQAYVLAESREKPQEKAIIQLIFTQLMLPDESFIAHIEELFSNWDDDADMMDQIVLAFISKAKNTNLDQLMNDDKWSFARNLLRTTIEKKEYCAELITPKLKNWDADRIANLDMILMRMGICELLYFETIPTKVTLNEYIDLAKDYSTAQSGQFVNGILDGIHKDLLSQGKIQKVNFSKSL